MATNKLARKFLWVNPLPTTGHLSNRVQQRIQLTSVLDSRGFNWQVWAVAATGFFTDSYALFATNVVLPVLAYVYWPNDVHTDHEIAINGVSLAGAFIGQILFGFLADRFGRQNLYGVELALVIIATFGVAQASAGVAAGDGSGKTSMSFLGWFLSWRFIMGIGIGAEYPLSAVITSEWASVRSRARMLAAVFIMQPIGQLVAYLVGLVALVALDRQYHLKDNYDQASTAAIYDKLWRWVLGVGALPALVALAFRLTIPESGRFVLDVQDDGDRAVLEAETQLGTSVRDVTFATPKRDEADIELDDITEIQGDNITIVELHEYPQFSARDMHQYFIQEGNWRYLAATSFCWFALDFAYYGLQINNPRFLARLWASSDPGTPGFAPAWISDAAEIDPSGSPIVTLYSVLMHNLKRALISVSIGAITGSVVLIKIINYLPRRGFLVWSFLGVAALLAGTGVAFLKTFRTGTYGITLLLYIMVQFVFNVGPNTLTFIIPAEIFPTRYRCTCHGISAAAGKLSSVIVQASLPYFTFGKVQVRDLNSNGVGWALIVFACVLALGALPAWAWLPEVQSPRRSETGLQLPSKTLEDLAEGRKRAEADGEVIGIRRRSTNILKRA